MFELALSHSKTIEFILTYDIPVSTQGGALALHKKDCSGRLGSFFILHHDKKTRHLVDSQSQGLVRTMRLLMTTLLTEQGRIREEILRWKELYGGAAPAVKTAEGTTLFQDLIRLSHLRILEVLLRRDYRGVSLPEESVYLDLAVRPRPYHEVAFLDRPTKSFARQVGSAYRAMMVSAQNQRVIITPKTPRLTQRMTCIVERRWRSDTLALQPATVRLLQAATTP